VSVTLWTFLAEYLLVAVVVALLFGRFCPESASDADGEAPPEA